MVSYQVLVPYAGPRVLGRAHQTRLWSSLPFDVLGSMIKWLRSNGAVVSDVEIAQLTQNVSGTTVRGLRATRAFEPGEMLFRVPFSAMLRSSEMASKNTTLYASTPGTRALTVLASAVLEAPTQWAPYIRSVTPSFASHPLWWFAFPDEFQAAVLHVNQSKALRSLAKLMVTEVASMRRDYHSMALSYEHHPKVVVRRKVCDPRQFVRALLHATSHHFELAEAIHGTEFKALVPLFDLINAPERELDANVAIHPRIRQGWSSHATELELVCTARTGIVAGQELYRTYHDEHGDVSAGRYLSVFGWLPAHMSAKEPRVSKAIARASALAAAAQQSAFSATAVTWPETPPYCTTLTTEREERKRRARSRPRAKDKQELRR